MPSSDHFSEVASQNFIVVNPGSVLLVGSELKMNVTDMSFPSVILELKDIS